MSNELLDHSKCTIFSLISQYSQGYYVIENLKLPEITKLNQ